MIYEPKNRTAEQILTATRFNRDHPGPRGWIRPQWVEPERVDCIVRRAHEKNKRPDDRLHALVILGKIYLHFDRNESGTHKSGQFGHSVQKCLKEFEAVDV